MRLPREYGPSLVVLGAAATVLLVGPRLVRQLAYQRDASRIELASERLQVGNILDEMNQAFRDIAVKVEPSVVHIAARQARSDGGSGMSTGSGWVYDADGHIVTNYHVIANTSEVDVQLSAGRILDAELVGSDPLTDIAVLRVDPEFLHPATRGDVAEPVEQGDMVFAFGSPFDFRFSMSAGVVSGKDRAAGVIRDAGVAGYENFIQTDAAINPGNSGGPLTDHRGDVIGMNTAIATRSTPGSGEPGQFAGIGLAIPLEMIEPIVGQIIDRGFVTRGFLGIELNTITDENRIESGWNGDGVLVVDVTADGPAAGAGLEHGDIITEINGERVATGEQLRARVAQMAPGSEMSVVVQRARVPWHRRLRQRDVLPTVPAGQPRNPDEPAELVFDVVLDELDTLRQFGSLSPSAPLDTIPALGIRSMQTYTPEMARRDGRPFTPGVLMDLDLPSPPNRRPFSGLILADRANGRDIRTVEELGAILRTSDMRRLRGRSRGVYIFGTLPNGRRDQVRLFDLRGLRDDR
ncbi:MAG: S1C family serine protease [Phycisphaerales bacterium]